eukprot:gene30263-35251_t
MPDRGEDGRPWMHADPPCLKPISEPEGAKLTAMHQACLRPSLDLKPDRGGDSHPWMHADPPCLKPISEPEGAKLTAMHQACLRPSLDLKPDRGGDSHPWMHADPPCLKPFSEPESARLAAMHHACLQQLACACHCLAFLSFKLNRMSSLKHEQRPLQPLVLPQPLAQLSPIAHCAKMLQQPLAQGTTSPVHPYHHACTHTSPPRLRTLGSSPQPSPPVSPTAQRAKKTHGLLAHWVEMAARNEDFLHTFLPLLTSTPAATGALKLIISSAPSRRSSLQRYLPRGLSDPSLGKHTDSLTNAHQAKPITDAQQTKPITNAHQAKSITSAQQAMKMHMVHAAFNLRDLLPIPPNRAHHRSCAVNLRPFLPAGFPELQVQIPGKAAPSWFCEPTFSAGLLLLASACDAASHPCSQSLGLHARGRVSDPKSEGGLNWSLLQACPSAARAAALWHEVGDWRKAAVLCFAVHKAKLTEQVGSQVQSTFTSSIAPPPTSSSTVLPPTTTGTAPPRSTSSTAPPIPTSSTAIRPLEGEPDVPAGRFQDPDLLSSPLILLHAKNDAVMKASENDATTEDNNDAVMKSQMGLCGLMEVQEACHSMHEFVAIPRDVLGCGSSVYVRLLEKVCIKVEDMMPKRLGITPLLPSRTSDPQLLLHFSSVDIRAQFKSHLALSLAKSFTELRLAHGGSHLPFVHAEEVVRLMLTEPEVEACLKMLLRWQGGYSRGGCMVAIDKVDDQLLSLKMPLWVVMQGGFSREGCVVEVEKTCVAFSQALGSEDADWEANSFMIALEEAAGGAALLPPSDLHHVLQLTLECLIQPEHQLRHARAPVPDQAMGTGDPISHPGGHAPDQALGTGDPDYHPGGPAGRAQNRQERVGWGGTPAQVTDLGPPPAGLLPKPGTPPRLGPPPKLGPPRPKPAVEAAALCDLNDLSLLVDVSQLSGTLLMCLRPHIAPAMDVLEAWVGTVPLTYPPPSLETEAETGGEGDDEWRGALPSSVALGVMQVTCRRSLLAAGITNC